VEVRGKYIPGCKKVNFKKRKSTSLQRRMNRTIVKYLELTSEEKELTYELFDCRG